jgi:hypothetical protein
MPSSASQPMLLHTGYICSTHLVRLLNIPTALPLKGLTVAASQIRLLPPTTYLTESPKNTLDLIHSCHSTINYLTMLASPATYSSSSAGPSFSGARILLQGTPEFTPSSPAFEDRVHPASLVPCGEHDPDILQLIRSHVSRDIICE